MAPPHNNNFSNKKRKKRKKGKHQQRVSAADLNDEEIPMKPPKQVKKSKQEKEREKSLKLAIANEKKKNNNPQKQQQQQQRSPARAAATSTKNPLLEAHAAFMANQCTAQERDNFFSNTLMDPDRRGELWMDQADRGEELVNQYAWAIPDDRAMRILKTFSPLVEIGCGANAYWSRLMAEAGVDIVAYDMFPEAGGHIMESNEQKNKDGKGKNKKRKQTSTESGDFQVQKGGPKVLASKELRDTKRTLFLCYSDEEVMQPTEQDSEDDSSGDDDEDEDGQPRGMASLGTECLKHYAGDYIIHVGELYGDTTSMDQAPWGRSSGAEFQQELAATFHCLLRVSLPNWIHVRDTLSVWKRSETCSIVFAADSDDEDNDDEEGDMEVEYKHIPVSERLPTDIAAPCLFHLLNATKGGIENIGQDNQSTSAKSKATVAMPKQKKKGQPQETPSSSSDDDDDDGSDSSEDGQEKKKQRRSTEESSSDEDEDDYEVQW